jgi:hypothetical protein
MDDVVEVPFGESPSDTATLLLAAAEELDGRHAEEVRTTAGAFLVPRDIAEQAGLAPQEADTDETPSPPVRRGRRRSTTTPEPGQEE